MQGHKAGFGLGLSLELGGHRPVPAPSMGPQQRRACGVAEQDVPGSGTWDRVPVPHPLRMRVDQDAQLTPDVRRRQAGEPLNQRKRG